LRQNKPKINHKPSTEYKYLNNEIKPQDNLD
jgi:hypothetical protein